MGQLIYVTHPDVIQDPDIPVPEWPLSERGRARMRAMLDHAWVTEIGSIYCSTERKALDGADILSRYLGLPFVAVAALGEVDRSATGFLPDAEHAALGRALFEHPAESVRGWETAEHAQQRVAGALAEILQTDAGRGTMALIGHGGVGTLLLCHLTGRAISLAERPPGADGGYYFVYNMEDGQLVRGWQRIDNLPMP